MQITHSLWYLFFYLPCFTLCLGIIRICKWIQNVYAAWCLSVHCVAAVFNPLAPFLCVHSTQSTTPSSHSEWTQVHAKCVAWVEKLGYTERRKQTALTPILVSSISEQSTIIKNNKCPDPDHGDSPHQAAPPSCFPCVWGRRRPCAGSGPSQSRPGRMWAGIWTTGRSSDPADTLTTCPAQQHTSVPASEPTLSPRVVDKK